MTFAWYGHLKYRCAPLFVAVLASWAIALGEYCFQVPANRIGYGEFTGYQLKIIQESVTLVVFAVFAHFYLGESIRWELSRFVWLSVRGRTFRFLGQTVTSFQTVMILFANR